MIKSTPQVANMAASQGILSTGVAKKGNAKRPVQWSMRSVVWACGRTNIRPPKIMNTNPMTINFIRQQAAHSQSKITKKPALGYVQFADRAFLLR